MIWLVVLTILKNTSQIGLLFPIYGKRVPNHQPEYDPFFAKSTVAGIVTWSMHGMIILNHRSKPPPGCSLPSKPWGKANCPLSININWLVVYLPLWKIWRSLGMMIPNTWKFIKFMFQTTNQYIAACFLGIESSYPNVGWWKKQKAPVVATNAANRAKLSQVAWKEKDEHQPELQRSIILPEKPLQCLQSSTWIDKLWQVFTGWYVVDGLELNMSRVPTFLICLGDAMDCFGRSRNLGNLNFLANCHKSNIWQFDSLKLAKRKTSHVTPTTTEV